VQIADIHAQKTICSKRQPGHAPRALCSIGYGLDSTGMEETVAKLKAGGLKSFHKKLATPNNCVIAIFGDVKTVEVKAAVETVFGGWKAGKEF